MNCIIADWNISFVRKLSYLNNLKFIVLDLKSVRVNVSFVFFGFESSVGSGTCENGIFGFSVVDLGGTCFTVFELQLNLN